ncbi:hypothetical protein GLAREA_09067 [Glarea lozoyensis ATCC 20868]|uniref:DUF7708 domain-containing protein n=1 Tax=Glarea lozoyensis (strain ATCC 20868 / MF5171) TaxID=1116229 RepID=S3DIC5_GLAL2|nr:uncharacterized protein GLAREA_09067 [Glarea lozoyensis ATCC 20868]EPE36904.1 hypothetical protein GLAREA_09067 [Glarea lozoyensis ATCC 20868]
MLSHYNGANHGADWADNVFKEAVAEFTATIPKKSSKSESVSDLQPSRLEYIITCLSRAQLQYQDLRGNPKIRKCLTAFAQKVHYYGAVTDALAQGSPQYVSFVYGAMKLVFVGAVNHEKSLAIIVDGYAK